MAKKLYRAREENRYIGGVCAGIADYFDIDPTLVRLIFLFIVLARGAGVLAYIIAWIVIPEKPYANHGNNIDNSKNGEGEHKSSPENDSEKKTIKTKDKNTILGIILMALGGIFLIDMWLPGFYWRRFWPILLIGLGAIIIIRE